MSLFHEASQPPLSAAAVAERAAVVLRNVDCDPSVIVTDAVIMVGGVAFPALADSIANSNVIGVVESKSSATKCDVRVSGVTPEIFAGLDETKEYVLSDTIAGRLVTEDNSPVGSGHVVIRLGQPFSPTRLMVSKGTRMVRS